MASVTACVRFRPLSSIERRDHGDSVCVRRKDSYSFVIEDEKEEEFTFFFDKVFYENSEQAQVYEFLALPVVKAAVDGINSTIITYGQIGAGKTYCMEGMVCNELEGGLAPRAVHGLFDCIKSSEGTVKYSIKLSMVEIYMENIRDLLDLSKDNIQIKESKEDGIVLNGVTEISLSNPAEAFQTLSRGIAKRTVGETQMNMSSSRSHCIYLFTVQQESKNDNKLKAGRLILVDLAGSEKEEKTGAEGKFLEEANAINKSLSALENVINALTCGTSGKANHIPYGDSKLTQILQKALGGNSRTALLCCCSPSPSNASESLSTLRFGMRFMASLDTVPTFELIFIQFPKQNYSLSVILEATDTVDTIKAKYNSEYAYHTNHLGPQHTFKYQGRLLTIHDDLKKLPRNSLLYVVDCTTDVNRSKTPAMDNEELLSPRILNNTDDDHFELRAVDSDDSEELLPTPKSYNSDVDYSELSATDIGKDGKKMLSAVRKFITHFRKSNRKPYNTRQRRREAAEYATSITCSCWTSFVHSLLLHLAIHNNCPFKLPQMDTEKDREETYDVLVKFFTDFRMSAFAESSKTRSLSAEYPLCCCWTSVVHSMLLHLAIDNDKSLKGFRSCSLINLLVSSSHA